jgi:uncharacterized protein
MTTFYRFSILCALVLLTAGPAAAEVAALDCRAGKMTPAEKTVCADAALVRLDDQLTRRLYRTARQLAFGPYVGLRLWQGDWRQQRAECSTDRACLAAVYSEANRFLDRFQRCLGTSQRGRRCMPISIDAERSLVRRP